MSPETIHRSARDLPVLAEFVAIWCQDHHAEAPRSPWEPPRVVGHLFDDPPMLCSACTRVLGYAVGRRLLCPYDPKPACKSCATPCYRTGHRETMRAIMRHSGWRLLCRGRWWLLGKYFF